MEHLQTSLWQQPWLCQSERAHPAAGACQKTPAAVRHIIIITGSKQNYVSPKKKRRLSKQQKYCGYTHTSLIMLRLAWSRGAGLPGCLKRRFRAFSLSSHWAAVWLWDLWISCRWLWRKENNHTRKYVLQLNWLFLRRNRIMHHLYYHTLTSSAGVSLCTERSLTVLWNQQRGIMIYLPSPLIDNSMRVVYLKQTYTDYRSNFSIKFALKQAKHDTAVWLELPVLTTHSFLGAALLIRTGLFALVCCCCCGRPSLTNDICSQTVR